MGIRNENGQLLPGHPGLKAKGSVNQFQKITREKLGDFLKERLDELPEVYERLSPKEKVRLILRVAEFFLPRQREMIVEMESQLNIDFSKLSPSALNEFLKLTEHEA
jgi:hypothetical protein